MTGMGVKKDVELGKQYSLLKSIGFMPTQFVTVTRVPPAHPKTYEKEGKTTGGFPSWSLGTSEPGFAQHSVLFFSWEYLMSLRAPEDT